MTAETMRYTMIMLAAGIGIPLLAALNAQLGGRIGSPAAAAVLLFCIAVAVALAVSLLTGGAGALTRIPGQPPHLFLAGALVAFYVLSVTWIAPRFGVGNAILCVLLGQMLSAAAIDHFGLFGAPARSFSPIRAAGLATMALGLFLTRIG